MVGKKEAGQRCFIAAYLFSFSLPLSEIESFIINALTDVKYQVDYVFPLLIKAIRFKQYDIEEEISKAFFVKGFEGFFEEYEKESASYNVYIAWLYIRIRYHDIAEEHLKKALEMSPRDYEANHLYLYFCQIVDDSEMCDEDGKPTKQDVEETLNPSL